MAERMVDVYHAFSEVEACVIKGKLEENGIPCVLHSNAAPSVYVFTVDGMGEIKVFVPESVAGEARRLIEEDSRLLDDGEGAPEGQGE